MVGRGYAMASLERSSVAPTIPTFKELGAGDVDGTIVYTLLAPAGECLSKVILFGERSLRRALSDYLDHFHAERNHQGKGNVLLLPLVTDRQREGPLQCRKRLGGLLRYHHREAA